MCDRQTYIRDRFNDSLAFISRAYFATEANQYFLAEAAVFAAIMLTSAVPLINGAHAVLKLIGA